MHYLDNYKWRNQKDRLFYMSGYIRVWWILENQSLLLVQIYFSALFAMFKVIVTSQFSYVSGLFLLCVSFNLVCWITSFRMCCYAEIRWNKKMGLQYNDTQKENNKNYEIIYVLLRLHSLKFQLLYLFLHIGDHSIAFHF